MATIYKICPAAIWRAALSTGVFVGSEVDRRDGYIHFSTAAQVAETAVRHFSGENDLVLVAVDSERLGAALKWEPARSGELFPHLYAPLDLTAAGAVEPLPLGADGQHQFPVLAG
jgi:uncharacterized protein (DUF952 family)